MPQTKLSLGFGSKPVVQPTCQTYHVELKRRFLTDDSELLLGEATIQVPKNLADPTGKTSTKREVWDAFARAVCYCLISFTEAEIHGLNQLFLFDNRWNLLERIETNMWHESNSTSSYEAPMSNQDCHVAWEAFKRCEVQVSWLKTPVVA